MSLWGKTDTQSSVPKFLKRGQVVTVRVTAGGAGYTNGAAATFTAAPAGGITATGTLVVQSGAVTGVTITNPGAGYVTAPTVSAAGGTGAVFQSVVDPIAVSHTQIVFVDQNEAAAESNRQKGIKTTGWNLVRSKVVDGLTRYFVDPIVAISVSAGEAGDGDDDALVADDGAFKILVQPTMVPTEASSSVVLEVLTSEDEDGSFQWQRRTNNTGPYANVTDGGIYSGATTASLTIDPIETVVGSKFRCVCLNAAANTSINSAGVLIVASPEED